MVQVTLYLTVDINYAFPQTAMRLESERKLMETHVEGLTTKLKDTQVSCYLL